jgi:5-methylcytosine-specific restriction endonuclease McrA
MATRKEHAARPGRESLRKRLGVRISRAIAERDDDRCVYCGVTADESGAHLHLDHLRPSSQGGADVASNLVTACRRCNTARQDMTVAQWSAYAAVKYGLKFSPRAVWGRARRRLAA